MIHDLMSRQPSSIPQFRGDLNGFTRELTQWLQSILSNHHADLSNAYTVTILTKIIGDPPKPLLGKGIMWITDGTGSVATALGAAVGDVLIAVNDGIVTVPNPEGLTTCVIRFDHSAGTTW
jgi:hypothetical protein